MILNDLNLYETRTLLYEPFWQRPFFWWLCGLVGFLCMLALVGLIIYIIRKRRNQLVFTPFERAVLQLNELKNDYDKQLMTTDFFYAQLSVITKNFITQVTGAPVHSCTDHELIMFLIEKSFLGDMAEDDLRLLLTRNSSAKFGRQNIIAETIENDYQIIGNLIRRINGALVSQVQSQK